MRSSMMRDILNIGQEGGIYIYAACGSLISEIEAAFSGYARSGLLLDGLCQQRNALRKRCLASKGAGVDRHQKLADRGGCAICLEE